jgi:transcriptional regulator with XRE-family HTH domain
MKERIRKLLASGIKASEVATIAGCSPGYVSQLLSDEEFKESVKNEMIQNAQEKTEEEHLDTRYQNLEHKILNNIEDALPGAELPQLTRALEVVAKRQTDRQKVKNPTPPANSGINIHVTQIALPQHVLEAPKPVISINEKNEIIAINAQPLAPMSADGVRNIFKQMQDSKTVAQAVLAEI